MSNYTKSTNFATKDNLTPGDPLKIVRGTEIDTEFNNIATAIATKTDNASAAITGGSITGITDLAIADGGTGASTANAALNNLLPSQASASGKYLKSNGTDSSWDALDISTADITGTLPVANGGTGVTSSTGTGSVVLSNSPTLVTPALGTPASGVATNITGLPISTGVSGLGTGVATALAVNVGSAGAPLVNGGVLGTPSSGTATNLTGLPLTTGVTGTLPIANGGTGQTTANAAFNALAPSQATASGKYLKSDGTNTSWDALDISTADITGTLPVANGGTGVTTSTGTGSVVLSNSPTLVTPALGTPSSATLTNATGLPISTGVSGLGTGVATALAVNVGSAGAPVVNGGALGTPSSGTVTNLTGTASININGTVGATTPTTGAFTTTTVSTSETLSYGTANGVTYLNGSKVLTSGSALTFDGSSLSIVGGNATINKSTNTSVLTMGGSPSANWEGDIRFLTSNTQTNWRISSNQVTAGSFTITPSTTGGGSTFTTPALIVNSSSNVGIGTTTPQSKLDVTSGNLSISQDYYAQWNVAGTTTIRAAIAGTSGNALAFYNRVGGVFTNTMTLDGSGNLGLGVTPSASTIATMQSTYAAITGNSQVNIAANAYYNGGWKYYATGVQATRYSQLTTSAHVWDVAGSGTAGNAITFTQAMTLDASGRLSLFSTSSSYSLQIGDGSAASRDIAIIGGTSNAATQRYDLSGTGTLTVGFNNSGSTVNNLPTGVAGMWMQQSYPLVFGTAATERMRIDSSGNLLVGTTSASAWSQAGRGLVEVNGSSTALIGLKTGGTQRGYVYHNAGGMVVNSLTGNLELQANGVGATVDTGGGFKTLNTIGVGNTTPSTSGAGITFPATQSASSDANTLDDYEEGTFSPTVIGSTTAGTATYSTQNARYTKIGRLVQFEIYLVWTGGTGTGGLLISGLPFVSSNSSTYPAVSLSFPNNLALTASNVAVAFVENNNNTINIYQYPTGGGASTGVSYDAAASIMLSGTYSI